MRRELLLLVAVLISTQNLIAQVYGDSRQLIKQYEQLTRDGKILEADKLILEANERTPVYELNSYAKEKIKTGDIKGANKYWDALIGSLLRKLPPGHVSDKASIVQQQLEHHFFSQVFENNSYGSTVVAVRVAKEYFKLVGGKPIFQSYFYYILNFGIYNSHSFNDVESLKEFSDIAINSKHPIFIFNARFNLLLTENKFEEAIVMLKNTAAGIGESAKHIKKIDDYFVSAYEASGDYENMMLSLAKVGKSGDRNYGAQFGLAAIHRKEYVKAIDILTDAMKPIRVLWISVERPGKFKMHTYRARAYAAMGDIINAKKDYERALVYNQNYQPALEGLATLEGKQIADRRTDKTGPEIKILEPTNKRGLKVVASGKDVMVKGIASDPSGIQEVSMNGQKIYAKEDGNFWGSVSLKDGTNKILILATDLAGNNSEHVFEIEKTTTDTDVKPVALTEKTGKNYAVFIASQNYDDSTIPSLENPISDAIKLKLILKNSYNFTDENIHTLFNPQRSDFKKKFLELTEALQPEDNLVIFYAGHGIWVDKEKKGYWLLTDAQRNDVNTWLPNKLVLDMIAELPSRHTLLITDACFSGSVFKSRSIGADAPAALKEMDSKITRVAITSGNDTEVPDVSVFMKYLVKALNENKDKYLTAQKMFVNQIIEAVMTETKTEPRYGTLELAGHVGGDFIFNKK
jgi:tetratricopeptide (TPR) repeat protein